MSFEELEPRAKPRVLDLVKEAGVDVTEWANSPRGAANPAYCYEWCFGSPPEPVVACLWFDEIHEDEDGRARVEVVLRDRSDLSGPQKVRADRLLRALSAARSAARPVRAIINAGPPPRPGQTGGGKRTVERRALDPEPWIVAAADPDTGRCVLVRGGGFVDQFSATASEAGPVEPTRRTVSTESFVRDRRFREDVLRRAGGQCEWCGASGFVTASGSVYLETHHIKPLGEGGRDAEDNMIALCPNDHRQAHHGRDRDELVRQFRARVTELMEKRPDRP